VIKISQNIQKTIRNSRRHMKSKKIYNKYLNGITREEKTTIKDKETTKQRKNKNKYHKKTKNKKQ
jgi:hypothetical protein